MFKASVFAALAAVAAAAPSAPVSYHPAPAPYHPAPVDESPKPYAFEYGVADDYSGAKFSQQEASDSKAVTGGYTVALPDGRTQIVTYTSDPYGQGGHVADVKYEGVAAYPEQKPAPYHPAPVIKPAPVYHA